MEGWDGVGWGVGGWDLLDLEGFDGRLVRLEELPRDMVVGWVLTTVGWLVISSFLHSEWRTVVWGGVGASDVLYLRRLDVDGHEA